jgi:integrase
VEFPKATVKVVGQMVGLTALEIKNARRGMHADGNGLYLCVKSGGAKSWVFRFQLDGKRREMGLGSLSALQPVKARAEAARLKAKLAEGLDPLEERRAGKEAASALRKQAKFESKRAEMTFQKAAEHFIDTRKAAWKNAKHSQQWTNTLATYAYPVIGDIPVAEVAAEHVVEILRPIWSAKSETASRVRMRIEAVLNAAKIMGWRSGDNPAVYKGGLEGVLPPINKVRSVRHHPAMPFAESPAFFGRLRLRDGIGSRALEFCILTAARSGEVRNASWDEVDLDSGMWVVPADRMKARREHRVPLSSSAIALLKAMPRNANSRLIFSGTRGMPMSDMTLSAVLKRMELAHFTVHGFRSSFRDWAAETTTHANETVEMALAHTIGNKTEAAYRRGDLLAKRRQLMEDWATFLSDHSK